MTRIKFITILVLSVLCTFSAIAETKVEKAERKHIEKIEKAKEDSINYKMAKKSMQKMSFVIMADEIGNQIQNIFVDDNMNFIVCSPNKAMIQIVPQFAGFNGLNLKGNLTGDSCETNKKGDVFTTLDIFSSEITARVFITLYHDSNEVRAVISPSFSRGKIIFKGKMFPLKVFPELIAPLYEYSNLFR